MAGDGFQGFPKEAFTFLQELEQHNDKKWFDAHKGEYEESVQEPSRAFVVALGRRLKTIAPGVHADPRVNKSLFRINRDTRFSKDKRPYKTHVGLWLWEGAGNRMECSGFYCHLDPNEFMLGVGLYIFPKHLLERYRQAVVHPKQGPALDKAVKAVTKKGLIVGEEHYKRVPRGYDADHKYAEYLKYGGLTARHQGKRPREIHSAKFLDYCVDVYKDALPLHKWLGQLVE